MYILFKYRMNNKKYHKCVWYTEIIYLYVMRYDYSDM